MEKEEPTIHPELLQVAQKAPRITFSGKNLWLFSLLLRLTPAPKVPAKLTIQNVLIPARDNKRKIRLRIYKPKSGAAPNPALIWMHGGGYVMGRPEQDDVVCIQYASELGITVVSVDYRLAPANPFPSGLEDCYTALKWVASYAQHLGVDNERIAIGGASAGGGLAAALAQLAIDRKEVRPAFQLLVYPMLDDRTVLRTDIDDHNGITWNQKSNQFGWEAYLGKKCGRDTMPDYAVPARREDLSNLPDAWIGVGTADLFHDEDQTYARRLKAAGVQCEMYIVSGAFHGFDVFDARLSLVQDFRNSQIAALKKNLFTR